MSIDHLHSGHSGMQLGYEMVTGRRYVGQLANFGERVLARLTAPNGCDKFQVAIWVGKTDRADFHLVFTGDGLRWTRTIRRMPVAYDAETLCNVRLWPWSINYGQIGVKQSALMAKVPSTPLPPQLAPTIREEERAERREARQRAQQRGAQQQQTAGDQGDQGQAGPGSDEAASDPSSTGGGTTSSKSSTAPQSVDDDMVLDDLVKNLKEDNRYDGDVDTSPKRGGEPMEEEVQSPSKALKPTAVRKVPRLGADIQASSTASASGANHPQGEGEVKIRMVVSGDLLEDGDLELPDQPPDLTPDELFQVEAESIKTEVQRLVEMGVLVSAEGADLGDVEKLSTRFVMDRRWRNNKWQRRARLVARDDAWINPNRTDTFAQQEDRACCA